MNRQYTKIIGTKKVRQWVLLCRRLGIELWVTILGVLNFSLINDYIVLYEKRF